MLSRRAVPSLRRWRLRAATTLARAAQPNAEKRPARRVLRIERRQHRG